MSYNDTLETVNNNRMNRQQKWFHFKFRNKLNIDKKRMAMKENSNSKWRKYNVSLSSYFNNKIKGEKPIAFYKTEANFEKSYVEVDYFFLSMELFVFSFSDKEHIYARIRANKPLKLLFHFIIYLCVCVFSSIIIKIKFICLKL
jgi:hypothetical protein